MNDSSRRFYASTAAQLTPLLAQELAALGAYNIRQGGAGAYFEGTLETAYRACLWSRVANRILLPITAFKATSGDELYAEAKQIRWERHLHSSDTFAIDCSTSKAAIGHSQYASLKLKDAVVDRFREKFGERPSVDTETPAVRINLHLRGDQARLAIDLAGSSLHRRGYRNEGGKAPLKENLAAALLLLADWPRLAAEGRPLVDPMCGSGTLLIEGAMIAADCAPGLGRDYFGFLGWRGHDRDLWQRLLAEAEQRCEAGKAKLPPIIGSDQDPWAVENAAQNIIEAGFAYHINVRTGAVGQLAAPESDTAGLLITNPPYGARLGELSELKPLYADLGRRLHDNFPGWEVALFTGNPDLAGFVTLPPSYPPTQLDNGGIDCRLFRYRVPELSTAAANAPVAALSNSARPFANRVSKNLKHLGKWTRREGICCYRIYDADLPDYALAIDLYEGRERWVHVQEYAPPPQIDPDRAWQRVQEALAVLPSLLEVPPTAIHLKVRRRQKGRDQYARQGETGRFEEVREEGCRLLINLSDYLDTGLFLDHRPVRRMIGRAAADTRFLNLFCYTAAVTVHAAVGGATSTTSVDMSKTYLDWGQRNLALNGFGGDEHQFVQADVVDWLHQAARAKREKYDLIFLDPPTFSNSKRMRESFDVQRDHVKLINDAMALLDLNGVLVFSNNFRKFKLDDEALKRFNIEEITPKTIDPDFARRPNIHRCWLIHHGGGYARLRDKLVG